MIEGNWLLRIAEGNTASVEYPRDSPDAVRVSITKDGTGKSYDIQLNQLGIAISRDHRYVLILLARADAPRNLAFGVAKAHKPWTNLGLYREVALSSKWQCFEETFVAAEDEEQARIHFDLGGSDASVELSTVSLRSLSEGRYVEPTLPSFPRERKDDIQEKGLDESGVSVGAVQFGSFLRVTPVSRDWGWDRGLPIDRHYIENFLASHSGDIRGRVLEIGDDLYSRKFGGSQIAQVDVLDIVEANPKATIVGDLVDAPRIPSDTFDCIILTQTLHFIYNVNAALQTLHRILKPGGVLLATFPGISHTNDSDWGGHWFWNFTPLSARRLFEEAFEPARVEIDTYGNVLSAVSFLHGLAAEELPKEALDHAEPGYVVTIAVKAYKNGLNG